MIHTRDLRLNIAQLGFEKGIVTTLELAIDEINGLKKNMQAAADLISMLADQMEQALQMTSGLTASVAEMRRVNKQGDEPNGN